jgi:regulator of sigma E protease
MDTLMSTLQALPTGIGSFFLLLGLLVFVHELGHFAVAKFYGVRVEVFSLGFGKKIFQRKYGDTNYCISLIPLGGYVKMFGDDPTKELPEHDKQFAFLHKPIWPRIAIVLAGPLMNLFFAAFLFFCLGYFGETVPSAQIGDVAPETTAYSSGFRSGDKITAINGKEILQWKDVKEIIEVNANRELNFKVIRQDGAAADILVTPKVITNPFIFSTRSQIGAIEGLELDSKVAIVGISDVKSAAGATGMGPLELIVAINGKAISYWREIEPALQASLAPGGVSKFVFSVQSLQELKGQKEPPKREVTIELAHYDKSMPVMTQLGFVDSQTFLLNVKKGSPGLSITSAVNESPASAAGLKAGDQITNIDGKPVKTWDDVLSAVKSYDEKSGGLKLTYRRANEEKTVSIVPEMTEIPNAQGGLDKRFAIGVVPAVHTAPSAPTVVKLGFGAAVVHGFVSSYEYSKLIGMSLVRLVQAEVSPRNIGGVFTIGRVASQSFEAGWDYFVKTMAVISINLFLLNLLPVPVLDGGHLVFFTIEAIRGAPLSLRKLEIAQQVGLVLLLSLMVFALFNDLTHWISSW